MKIFDAHISGSLSVSSSAHIEGDLTVLGTLFATVSGTTTNALTASEAPRYTLTSSFNTFTSSYTTGSFTGSFIGDGGNLYNIPASGVTGLNLNKITSGSVSASISPDRGLEVNTNLNVVGTITAKEIYTSIVTSSVLFESGSTIFGNSSDDTHQITGSVGVTGSLTLNNDPVVVNTTFNSFTSSANGRLNSIETSTSSLNSFTSSADGRLSSIEGVTGSIALLNTYTGSNDTVIGTLQTSTSSLNSFTSSINTTIKNKLNSDNVISGSSQVILTGTTGYSNFSSSVGYTTITIENRVGSLETESGSIRTAFNSYTSSNDSANTTQNSRLNSLETTTGSLNTFTSSANSRLNSLESFSGTLNTYTSSANGRLNSIETSTGSLNSFSSSTLSSLTAIHTSTGSLNTFSSSTLTRLTNLESASSSIRSDFNSYTSSTNGRLSSIETSTGSLNTFSSSTLTRLTAIETSTSSLNSYTSSNTTSINAIHTATSSLNSYTSSNNTILGTLQTATSSLNTFSSSTNTRLSAIETSTGSLNLYTSSNTTNINAIHTATSSLNSYTSSNNTTLGTLQTATGALNTFSSSANTRLTAIETSTSSLNSYTSSNTTNISAIHTATSSLNSYTSSNNTRLGAIETSTSSLNSFTSSINTTIKNRLNAESVISGSVQVNLTSTTGYSTFSSSLATTDSGQDSRLTSLEGKTGSYATTGSNVFQGDQTITGSLYISQNLIIGGSSSIQHITSSQLNIGDNIITVNAQNPSIRFGGLAVIDSGSSPQVSGSILFDSVNNQWIFVHQNQSTVTSSVLLMGPETYNNLGGESYITQNKIIKSTGIEHLAESNITDTGTKVSINSNTEITGTFVVTGTALVSGSGQISFNGITDKPTLVSGSSQISFNGITDKPTLVSGSSQITFLSISSIPSGLVSGSSQVLAGTTIHSGTFFNGISVVSGSGQISFNGITDKPTLVSGSSQITFGSITGIPSGLVSGSSQISFGSISGVPSGLVSGSSQVLNGSGVWSGSAQLPSGVVSGSSQISFGSISGVPSGLVSGSSQITFGSISSIPSGLVSGSSQISIASTTGFGTYLNQGVLTSSSPTFAAITIGKSGTDSTITFPAQTNDPGYIKHYESNNTAIMYFNVSDDTNDEFHFGYTADASTFRLRADGVVLEGTWQGSSISTAYTDAKVTSINAGTGISVNATTGAVTVTNTITNNNQLTNGAGYITSYTETDTLATVTGRGASTSTPITVTASEGREVAVYMPSSYTTDDLVSGHEYGWYNDHWRLGMTRSGGAAGADFVVQWNAARRLSLTSGGNLTVTGTISASNFSGSSSGTNTGDQTNISGLAGSETLSTVTGRGASTSTALSINNTLTITSGRVIIRTGGANTYGIVSGYDNSNHLMTMRADIAGSTSSPTITAGHQMCFVEYAEANDTTGWFFKSSSTGTYQEIARITRSTFNYNGNTVYHSGNLTNLNQLTNGPGYITSLTDTLATVTARGASTSTAISLSGNLTMSGAGSSTSIIFGDSTKRINVEGYWMMFKGHENEGFRWQTAGQDGVTYTTRMQLTSSALTVNGSTVWHQGNLTNLNQLSNGPGYATLSGSNSFTNSYNEFGDGTGSVSNDGGWNGRLNLAGSQHARLDVTSVSDGIITTMYAHTGHAAGRVGTMSNHDLLLMIQGAGRVRLSTSGHLSPEANGTQNLGSSSLRWNTVFTSDLSMSNGIGDYTIVEGEEDLFIYNNKNNKVFKFLLQEVDPSIVPPKKI